MISSAESRRDGDAKPLRTSDLAQAAGVHPNTIRLYEAWGFLPPPERGPNGYRMFTQRHLQQALLVRLLGRCTWLGGTIREHARTTILRSAAGDWAGANASVQTVLDLVIDERSRAEQAVTLVEAWQVHELPGKMGPSGMCRRDGMPSRGGMSRRQAAAALAVTADTLRNWERNGLIKVPRQSGNAYRAYGPIELRRLAVIRALRRARYSLMAILRMFRQLDADPGIDPGAALDTLQPHEEDVFNCMDRWLTRVREIEATTREAVRQVEAMSEQFR